MQKKEKKPQLINGRRANAQVAVEFGRSCVSNADDILLENNHLIPTMRGEF